MKKTKDIRKKIKDYIPEKKAYEDMLQSYLHISVMSDILIGQIEYYQMNKLLLDEYYQTKDPELKQISRGDTTIERLLVNAKMQFNESKNWIKQNVGNEEVYNAQLGVSKTITSMLEMSSDQIALMMLSVTMINKGLIPSYIDLKTADLQRLSQKTNIPLEWVRMVFTHLVDVAIDPTDTLKNT